MNRQKQISFLFFPLIFLFLTACFFDPHALEKQVDTEKSNYYYYTLGKKKIVYKYKRQAFGIPQGWSRTILEEADAESFTVIHSQYGKDKKHVFYKTYKTEADPGSFQLIPENVSYGKDKEHVYLSGRKVNNVDVSSFRVSNTKAMDKNHVFLREFEDEENGILKILEGADPGSYTHIRNHFAKDKDAYFYMEDRIHVDVPTFRFLSSDVGIDKDSVYYFRGKVKNGHGKTFRYHGEVKRLGKNVFYDHQRIYNFYRMPVTIIPANNIQSLEILDTLKNVVFKIDNRLFWDLKEKGVMIDFDTFRYIDEEGKYGVDKNHVYWRGDPVENADPSSFRALEDGFYCDKEHVFYYTSILSGADPSSFVIEKADDGKKYVRDKNYRWKKRNKKWERVEKKNM